MFKNDNEATKMWAAVSVAFGDIGPDEYRRYQTLFDFDAYADVSWDAFKSECKMYLINVLLKTTVNKES